jgi:predicted XRE-type DNA-binding protein
MKSRDDLHAKITVLLSEGFSQADAAKQLGVSTSTVSRVLAEHYDADGHRQMQDAVDAFITSLGLDLSPDVRARVALLRNTAEQLDRAAASGTGTAMMATAALNKDYCSLVDELRQSASLDELREALLAAGD